MPSKITIWRRANPAANQRHRDQEKRRYHASAAVRQAHKEAIGRFTRRDKIAAYEAYGGFKCACPGCDVTEEKFLTIDHINNDGAEHRRAMKSVGPIYRWLRVHGYPPGFQVLCWNCNCGKRFNGGVCPHNTQTGCKR